MRGLLALVGALIILLSVLQRWTTNTYALTPGDATSVAPLVTVQGLATDPHRDRILLTDVYLTRLSALQWLAYHLKSHVEFVPSGALIDPGVPASELTNQGYLEMSDSKMAAEVAALRALGWKLPSHADGAVVTAVAGGSPALRAGIHVADRVVAVGSTTVSDACGLVRAAHSVAPGTRLVLHVEHASISAAGKISWSAPRDLTVRTASSSGSTSAGCAGVSGKARSWLGLSVEDGISYRLPGSITIDTNYIGGPSAGLAMTLALIDRLSRGSLTGKLAIAATGTIAPNGAVGDVGGVAEKTVAVERAGARVFFVPQVEVPTASSAAGPGLRIIGVTSLAQVLKDLRRLGGADPTPLTHPTNLGGTLATS